jgi:endonuclease/exonuclease/phosphatase family metal-dependent hydrolase
VRVVTWNMAAGFGFNQKRHELAWRYLQTLDPDIALLQEAVPPNWARSQWSIVARRSYPPVDGRADVPWGSAVVAREQALSEHIPDSGTTPWLHQLRGSAVIARIISETPLWIASIHSNAYPIPADCLDRLPTDGLRRCHETEVWEIELVAMEFEQLVGHGRFIAGGDLNSALLFDTISGDQSNQRLFGNLRDSGFHDLRTSSHEQQAYFKAGRRPYQLDHVFADATTAAQSHTWRVIPEPAADLDLSDHAPIEVDFARRL